MPAPYSFTIAGSGYNVRAWPKPSISPAIQWITDSAGYPHGSDRGAPQDIYESQVVFFDTESAINNLESTLQSNREGLMLAGFTAPLFAPNVNHTGSLTAAAVAMGRRKHLKFAAPSTGIFELPVTFRAISPTLLSTTPSISTLKLQDGFEAGKSFDVGKGFSYNQNPFYHDSRADEGRFAGVFKQKTAQAQAILAYLLTSARASSFAFPSIGVTYPFGSTKSATPNCKVTKISIERADFVFWNLSLEFMEAP